MSETKKKKPKKRAVSVTMKLNKDGTMTMRSTGGYDLRKLFPPVDPASRSTKEGE